MGQVENTGAGCANGCLFSAFLWLVIAAVAWASWTWPAFAFAALVIALPLASLKLARSLERRDETRRRL